MANNRLQEVCSNPPLPPEGAETVTCTMCHRPLERATAYQVASNWFCCEKAAQQHMATDQNVEAIRKREKAQKTAKLIRNLVMLFVLLGILGGAYFFYRTNDDFRERVHRLINKGKETAGEFNQQAQEALDKAQEGTTAGIESAQEGAEQAEDAGLE